MTNDLLGALFASEDGLTDFCQWLETDKNTTVKQKKTILEQLKELIQKAVERLKEYFNKEKFTDTQKAVSEMELEQAQQFRQQCLAILDHAISNLENGVEISNGNKYSFDNFDKIKKSDVENIKAKGNKIIDNEKELLQCVENSLNNRQLKENYYLGNIKQGVKERITNDLNLDIFKKGDYSFSLSSDDIRHIYEHFGSSNDIVNAIYRLYDVVNNYDTVSIDDEQRKRFKKNVLVFNKSYSDYDFRSVEIASKKNRTFDLVSFFVTKNNKKRNNGYGPANTENNGELASRTATASINSISKKSKDVKKYSLDIDSEGNKLSEQQIKRYKNVAPELRDEQGRIKPFYHGTARADRVGNYFNPDRATSGPMAYFTDSEKIAGNYSRNKTDTSIAYDNDYDSYETQFRVNDKPITNYWYTLSPIEKRSLTQKIQQVTLDDEDNIVLDPDNKYGIGNFNDYELHYAKGNALQVLVDGWLGGGTLFGEEKRFVDVLNTIGIKNVEYKDPDYREEKVYKVYLNITNPFNTDNLDNEFISDLEDYISSADMSIYDKENSQADMWDKNSIDIYDWIERLKDDLSNGTTHAWTSIPDVVTDFLKEYGGYNGIIDKGGKNGGDIHTVAIPFYSNQIKNIDNTSPTDNVDIRYSIDIDEFDAEDYTSPRLAKKEYNRLRREALAFNADKVNKIITQNLDNGYKYAYYFDDEYNLIVLGKTKSTNIHERYKDAKRVANGFTERFNNAESERGNLRGSNIVSENRRTDKSILSNVNNNIQKERKSDRRGNAQNGYHDNLSEEKRYSIDIDKYDTRSLIKQNKQLQKSVEYYKMMLGYNSGHKVNRNKIRSYAVELKKQWNTALSTDDIADSLAEIFDFISSGNATWDSIESMGNALGKEIVYNIKQETDPENQAVLDDLKQYTVSIDSHQRDEITYYYGGMGALTKKCE